MALKIVIGKKGGGSSNDNNSASNPINKLTRVMKDFTGLFKKATRLGQSGFGGLMSAGGGIAKKAIGAAGGVAAAGAAIGGAAAWITDKTMRKGVMVDVDGEQMVARINQKTGEIEALLTIEEAQQKGMVDEYGKLYETSKLSSKKAEEIFGEHSMTKDILTLSLEELQKHYTENLKQTVAEKRITAAKIEYARQMEARIKKKARRDTNTGPEADGTLRTIGFGRVTPYTGNSSQETSAALAKLAVMSYERPEIIRELTRQQSIQINQSYESDSLMSSERY